MAVPDKFKPEYLLLVFCKICVLQAAEETARCQIFAYNYCSCLLLLQVHHFCSFRHQSWYTYSNTCAHSIEHFNGFDNNSEAEHVMHFKFCQTQSTNIFKKSTISKQNILVTDFLRRIHASRSFLSHSFQWYLLALRPASPRLPLPKKISIVQHTEEQMNQHLISTLLSVHRENRQYQPH